ncbi:L,D-transpeptidase [Staphylococcus chromogenes]|nr:L,D-transpeptidase [Staphylococcus chromogenes]
MGKHSSSTRRASTMQFYALGLTGLCIAGISLGVIAQVVDEPKAQPGQPKTVAEDVVVSEETSTVQPIALASNDPHPDFAKCPPTARACVDLTANVTWLQKDGKIEYGPVIINHGSYGHETPPGNYQILRHVQDEVSYELNLEPMPWATYFSTSGMAFHEDDVTRESHGCIHMTNEDAKHYFQTLKKNDSVVIF